MCNYVQLYTKIVYYGTSVVRSILRTNYFTTLSENLMTPTIQLWTFIRHMCQKECDVIQQLVT